MPCLEYGLAVVDGFLILFVFFPLSILHWRGTWQLQDVYIKPDSYVDSNWIGLGLGLNLCLIELLCQVSYHYFFMRNDLFVMTSLV